MLSVTTSLIERIQYEPQNVNPDEIHDALLELEGFRQVADSPDDLQAQIDELEEWRDIRINGMKHGCKSAEHLEQRIAEYTQFFDDCVATSAEYDGDYPCAEPYNFHALIAEKFEQADALKQLVREIVESTGYELDPQQRQLLGE